ncbi:MAG: hypothetical protein ABWZ25_03230 [Chitinophagaceae bacterium]
MTKNIFRSVKSCTAALLLTAVLFSSCKKDDNNSDDTAITEEEAAEVISEGVSNPSGGFAEQTVGATVIASKTYVPCGQRSDTLIGGQSLPGAAISFSYRIEVARELTCIGFLPEMYSFSYKGSNTYDGPRMSSDDKTTAAFNITGLMPTAPGFILNQSYERTGTQQTKIGRKRSFTSTLKFNSTAIVVDKISQKISSGTAAVEFTGKVSSGREFNYGATITFHGNNTATLLFKNGTKVELAWQ